MTKFLKKILKKLSGRLANTPYEPEPNKLNTFGQSETSKCRNRLAPYCIGYGLDLGFGGDPITSSAIRMDFPLPYTHVGDYPVQLGGQAENLYWFNDNVLDYVYSSHLLEDFQDTEKILREWLRVIKPGGKLIIFCPDEQRFRIHCKETGQPYNTAHVHEFFSLKYVITLLEKIGETKVIYQADNVDIYSWDLVCEKL
ncbi:methyltransferase domain-containing protein [Daejeonella oryzae]|uniref:methyltransferase domain-containing protein n=1 Tax=Daejeonella oryzae TaxID=1122943 RepID=UPI0004056F23|nr:methyltransferase domain-containing protein [Daejeonella oryzae]